MLYHSDLTAKFSLRIVLCIDTIYFYRSFLWIIESRDQADQCTLTTSGSSDNSNRFSGMNFQIDVFEYLLCTVFLIRKVYIFKCDASICDFVYRILRIVNICSLFQHFRDTTHTCHTHGNHNENHRKHHQTHKNKQEDSSVPRL